MPMKICFITGLFDPYVIGGAEVYISGAARRLSRDHEVSIITSRPFASPASCAPEVFVEGALRIHRFYPLNLYHAYNAARRPNILKPLWHAMDVFNPHSYYTVRHIVRSQKPDVVHAHNLGGISLSAARAVKDAGIPLVMTCHDYALLCPYTTLHCSLLKGRSDCANPFFACAAYRRLKRKVISRAPDCVIFPSAATMEVFDRHGYFPGCRREVLHYFTDMAASAVPAARPVSGTRNILYVGQLVRHKGVQTLIEAFKGLAGEDLRLHIAGSGPYEGFLKNAAGSDARIVFHGKVSHDRLATFFCSGELTVVPSLWEEVLGIVILESFSCGVPVLGSALGGIKEVIKNGRNGFTFKPGDVLDLREKIRACLVDTALLDRMKKNASADAANEFSLDSHCRRLENIYTTVIRSSR